jgi:hypothetical protein
MIDVPDRPHIAVRLIPLKFFLRHFLASSYELLTQILIGFVIRTEEFFLLYKLVNNLPIELRKPLRKALAKNLEPPMPGPDVTMPIPEVTHPVLPIVNRLTLHFGRDVVFGLP